MAGCSSPHPNPPLGEAGDGGPILSVFWCGTAGSIDPPATQIGLFAQAAGGEDLSDWPDSLASPLPRVDPRPSLFKLCFDGIGYTGGCSGTLFATGLKRQADRVVRVIQRLRQDLGPTVRVNVLGLSRGGMASLYLCQALERAKDLCGPQDVDLRLLLFDPVPGNQVSLSTCLRGCGLAITTSNQALNVSKCAVLSEVLAIYPHEPLPDISFHAPILPSYPRGTVVEEDVTLGCHQGALFDMHQQLDSALSFARIHRWLEDHGTPLTHGWFGDGREARSDYSRFAVNWAVSADGGSQRAVVASFHELEERCLQAMNSIVTQRRQIAAGQRRRYPLYTRTSTRRAHAAGCATVLSRLDGEFLNRHHEALHRRHGQRREEGRGGGGGGGGEDASGRRGSGTAQTVYMLRVDRHARCFVPLCPLICLVLIAVVVLIILAAQGTI